MRKAANRFADGQPMTGRWFRFVIILLSVAGGCSSPSAPSDQVVALIGHTGLAPGDFSYPRAIAAAPDGRIFVVDKSARVQRFSPSGTFEASWTMPRHDEGKPVGLAVHPDGRVFVADTHCHRVMVFDAAGTILGEFGSEGTGDGQFQLPTDVAFDENGFIYVSEYYGNDRITKWSPDFSFIKSFGRSPIEGKSLSRPTGLVVDDEQTLWVADACNHRLVRFSLEGDVLKVIGKYGRNPGELRYPYDLSLAPDGALLVSEYEGNRLQWLSKDGQSMRVWGSVGRKPGEVWAPWGAVYGPNGLVYICDSMNDRMQIIRP